MWDISFLYADTDFVWQAALLQRPPLGPALRGLEVKELRHRRVSREAMATARTVVSCQVSTPGNGGEAFDSSSDQRSSPSITSPCQPVGKFSPARLNSLPDHRQNRCQLTFESGSNLVIVFQFVRIRTHCGAGRCFRRHNSWACLQVCLPVCPSICLAVNQCHGFPPDPSVHL